MSDTQLQFSDVTFGFGVRKPMFHNLTFALRNDSSAGKIIALMGPSGVGKTTFCDLALGIHQPQKGSVKFAPDNANIAVIPQKGIIFDELSVRENITCLKYSKSLGGTFREDKVQRAVESLNLTGVIQSATKANALSGGEAQRVMLARIQTIACDVLILDEPCSFLDNRIKDSFLAALRTTVESSRLLALMVTHVWDEAQLVADEVVFFHQANGNPVTLHRTSPAQAAKCPPTIDALFSIHWPDCAVFSRSDIAKLPKELVAHIPQDTHYVGFFDARLASSEHSALANSLWSSFSIAVPDTSSPSRNKHAGQREHISAVCVFYGEGGVVLQTARADTSNHEQTKRLQL